MNGRCLFVIRDLPRPVVSGKALIRAEEALSGTHASGLLVAEGLARRGHEIGICIVHGQRLLDSAVRGFPSLEAAVSWVEGGRVVWLSYGDDSVMSRLSALRLQPLIWTQLPVSWSEREWLESGQVVGIVVVSDTARVPLLRSARHGRVGRIYNPLPPLFADATTEPADRFRRRVVVYAGAAGPTKGLHRLLEMWRHVRKAEPGVILRIAGTGRLYGSQRELGAFGIASPEFESRYVAPLAAEFGSLAAAGVELVGLLSPRELRDLYGGASLGIVNMNWHEYTETFCCAATEMLATGLPVFSVARGALPETVGLSGGAVLTRHESAAGAAEELTELIVDPERLARLGAAGQAYVRAAYRWDMIIDEWEQLLHHAADIETLCGPWRGPRSARYYLELAAGRLRAPWLLDLPAATRRALKRETA
jgi:glycosyltransferase involved in cell wall biosynthesis